MLLGIDGPKEASQFAFGVLASAANRRGSASALACDGVPPEGIAEPE
jgi:hypothetical protein